VKQMIINGSAFFGAAGDILRENRINRYLLVHGGSAKRLPVWDFLQSIDIPCVCFSDITSNPKYEEVVRGVEIFNREGCDGIVAIGGGSVIDVAKCIKLYCKMDSGSFYLKEEYKDTGVPLIAIPTTAGTGSESTPFSVIYYEGEKQSVKHPSILPNVAVLDPDVLKSLPIYQKKCTVLDAFCQAIESYWSVNSTEESRAYAKEAIIKIRYNINAYIDENSDLSRAEIMTASNLAGQAIAITATTAPHAMSYKLTTTYGFPHGHSVAISLPMVWKYMLSHPEKCIDKRGADYVFGIFDEIAEAMGYSGKNKAYLAAEGFEAMLKKLDIVYPNEKDREERAKYFADSVNVDRLGNNPITLSNEALFEIYKGMMK